MKRTSVLLMLALMAACGRPGAATDPAPRARDDLAYSCGAGGTFTPADIAAEKPPAQDILDEIERLRGTIDGQMLPADGWWVVSEDDARTTLLAPSGKERFASITFEKQGKEWQPAGWGDCAPPRLAVEGKSVLRWAFTPESYPPEPETTRLSLLVTEVDCSSGRSLEGLIEPDVTYGESQIDVVLTAPALGAATCPGNPVTEYELQLEQPVGERKVIDPSAYPPVEPTPGTPLP